MDLFNLVAKITLDQSSYDSGLDEASGKFTGFGDKLKAGLGTAAKVGAATVAAVGAAGAALTKTILDGASKVAEYGDNIDKMSQKMGISAKAYQEWDAILQHSGSSIDGMQRGMMTLSKAAETGSDAFQKLGISEKDVASMSQEDLFAAVIKGLQGMEEGTERTVLAQELLGGAAKELGPLLNTTAEDTEKMRQRVHELGGVMSDEAVKAAAAYQDALQDMKTAFSGLKNNLFSQFMPGITTVMDGLTKLFSGNEKSGVMLINTGLYSIGKTIKSALPKVIGIAKSLMKTLGKVFIDNLPVIINAGTEILVSLVTGIIEALPQLVAMIPQVIVAIWDALKENWPMIKEAGIQLLIVLAQGLADGLGWALGAIVDTVTKLWDKAKSATVKKWNDIKSAVTKKVESVKSSLAERWDDIKAKVSEVWDSIKEKISEKIDAVKGKFEALKTSLSTLKTKFTTVLDAIKKKVDEKLGPIKSAFNSLKDVFDKLKEKLQPIADLINKLLDGLSRLGNANIPDKGIGKSTVAGNGFSGVQKTIDELGFVSVNKPVYTSGISGDADTRLDEIVALLEQIVRNGLNANIDKRQLLNAVASENRIRTRATNYNPLSMA